MNRRKSVVFALMLFICGSVFGASPRIVESTKIYYTWVDNVNVRNRPSTTGKVIAKLEQGEDVLWTGTKTRNTLKLTLRGKNFDKPWAKIKTQSGKTGWVYAGALKKKEMVYSLVQNLRVRLQPTTDSKVLTKVNQAEELTYLGYQTAKLSRIKIRNKMRKAPWIKVKTEQGTIGWVYGGAMSNLRVVELWAAESAQSIKYAFENARDNDILLFRTGRFVFPGRLELKNKYNISIITEGKVEIVSTDKSDLMMTFENCSYISIEGLHMRHAQNIKEYESCMGEVLYMYGCTNIDVINNELNGCGTVGVAVYHSTKIDIKNNNIHHNSREGIVLQRSTKVNIIKNRIADNKSAIIADNQNIAKNGKYVNDLVIKGNTFINNKAIEPEYEDYED